VESGLDVASSDFSDGHRRRVSRSPSPQDSLHSADTVPRLGRPASSTVRHGHRHLRGRLSLPGRRRVLSTNVRSRSSTPSRPLFFARALYSRPSSRRRFSPTKPPCLQPFNATTDASLAAPLPGTPPAQPPSVTFSGRRLNLSSFSGHPAWAWIFVSKLSFIYPRTLWNAEVTSCFHSGAHREGGVFYLSLKSTSVFSVFGCPEQPNLCLGLPQTL
jgi:hypothetical protein